MAQLTPTLALACKHFNADGSVISGMEKLLSASVVTAADHASGLRDQKLVAEFVQTAPHLVCLMAGALQLHASMGSAPHAYEEALFTTNARATIKALHSVVIGPDVFVSSYTGAASTFRAPAGSLQAFRQRVLVEQTHLPAMLAANSSDVAALRFVAEVSAMTSTNLEEVAQAVKGARGQAFVQTLRSSPTFASVVIFSSWWGDLWDGIKGAAAWVSDAARAFGEEAAKVANAVVEGVFSKFEGVTKFLEAVPGVGLVVAGIYYIAGKTDQGTAALAINLNAIVTVIAAGVGFAVAGPAGAMIGGALGKAAGLLLQKAMAQLISDPKIKADVGDISATQFVIEIALSGAADGGAGAVADALAEAAGMSAIKAFLTSKGLPALLAELPAYLASVALEHTHISGGDPARPGHIHFYTGPGPVIIKGKK